MCAKALTELADAKERGYYSIGRAAELSGVTAKMIRHYESLELIPKAARTLGDYRLKHLAELDSKIEELQSMRTALADLAAHCHGDQRPECPILDDLGRLLPPE